MQKTIEVQGCGFEAKGRRSREMIDPSDIEANSSCYRSAKHRVLDRRVFTRHQLEDRKRSVVV